MKSKSCNSTVSAGNRWQYPPIESGAGFGQNDDGVGIAPASKYYGFYYSPDDVPVAYQNVNDNLTHVSDDEWKWSDNGTDNGDRTIRIIENWFYYEAWF